MPLFREPTESDDTPKRYAETVFAFLSRSTRPGVASIRAELESWFSRYPPNEQEELSRRFRLTFEDAFFELFSHELLLRTGHVIAVHPELPHTSRRPDFLGTAENDAVYLEATVISGVSDEERQERAAHDLILDALNTFNHPDFFFGVADIEGIPRGTPSRAALHGLLAECARGLDPDDVARRFNDGLSALARSRLTHAGLVVEVFAIPKSEASRGKPGLRAIGIGPTRGGIQRHAEELRAALKRKGRAYGRIDKPLVIAANATNEFGVEHDDVVAALFGNEVLHDGGNGGDRYLVHDRNGLWTDGPRPTYTRISAVIIGRPVLPWNLAEADLILYHNPWATIPYDGPLTSLTRVALIGDQLVRTEGRTVREIFNLPVGWPKHAP